MAVLLWAYFFLDNRLTSYRYRHLPKTTLQPYLDTMALISCCQFYIQQAGTPPHFSCTVCQWLGKFLSGWWISSRGLVEWPPCSPDLTPLEFLLWDHLKYMVFGNQLQSTAAPQDNIHAMQAAITPAILWWVCLAYGAIFTSVTRQTSVWTLTVVNVQTSLVFYMNVWFCGLAVFCHTAALLLYDYIKTQWFYLLLLFHVVPVSPLLPLPPTLETYALSPSRHLDNIAVTFYYWYVKSVVP
jgi:hypothetical protein